MLSVNIHSVVLSCMTVCLLCCEMSLQCVNGSIKMVSDGITLKAHCTAFHCTNESSGSFVPFFTNSVLTWGFLLYCWSILQSFCAVWVYLKHAGMLEQHWMAVDDGSNCSGMSWHLSTLINARTHWRKHARTAMQYLLL